MAGQNQLGDRRVCFIINFQLIVHQGNRKRSSRQEPGGRSWSRKHRRTLVRSHLSYSSQTPPTSIGNQENALQTKFPFQIVYFHKIQRKKVWMQSPGVGYWKASSQRLFSQEETRFRFGSTVEVTLLSVLWFFTISSHQHLYNDSLPPPHALVSSLSRSLPVVHGLMHPLWKYRHQLHGAHLTWLREGKSVPSHHQKPTGMSPQKANAQMEKAPEYNFLGLEPYTCTLQLERNNDILSKWIYEQL